MQRRPKEEERGKKESWSGFRFTFEQRSFCFHRFGTARRERENFHIVHRSPQNSKQLFQESLWISSPLLQSVSTTEKTSSLSSLLFLSLRHTDISLRWTLAYFPFFSSFSLLFSLANFFFTYRNSSGLPSLTPFVAHQRREFRDIALPWNFLIRQIRIRLSAGATATLPGGSLALQRYLSSPSSRQWIKGSHTASPGP